MAQVQKDRFNKRHSIAVTTNTIRESEEDVAGSDASSNSQQSKNPEANKTVSLPPAAKSFNRQRSISFCNSNWNDPVLSKYGK